VQPLARQLKRIVSGKNSCPVRHVGSSAALNWQLDASLAFA